MFGGAGNHKGDQHYLVIFECHPVLQIHDLEKRLKQGKLSFASPERMFKFLILSPSSVSPFGLINDKDHHVIVYIDNKLEGTVLGFVLKGICWVFEINHYLRC